MLLMVVPLVAGAAFLNIVTIKVVWLLLAFVVTAAVREKRTTQSLAANPAPVPSASPQDR